MKNQKKYVDEVAARLKVLDNEIKKLEIIADKAVKEVKADYEKQIYGLFLKKERLKRKVSKIREASGNAWEDMKAGADLSWEVFNEAVKKQSEK